MMNPRVSAMQIPSESNIQHSPAILYQTARGRLVYYRYMDEQTDDYAMRKRAGEEAGDILAEEARLEELGVGFPLNMMHTLYYEGSGDSPEELRPRIAELVAESRIKTQVRLYEQK